MKKPRHPPGVVAPPRTGRARLALWTGLALAGLAALAWAYWPTMLSLYKDWQHDDDYSVGQLVPLVAAYFVWRERAALRKCDVRPCWAGGVGLLLLAQAGLLLGVLFLFESAERYALVLTVVACVLLIAGRQVFRRLGWVMLFLFLMVPLPGRIHNMISGPLQTMATSGAVFLVELFGYTVAQAGNVLEINGYPVAVEEACAGLRMLTAFVIVSATLAYLVNRPRWQKAALLASSVPIAVLINVARLGITAALFAHEYAEAAKAFFHDFAGLAMMPPAVLILAGELFLMKKLVLPDAAAPPAVAKAAHPARAKTRGSEAHRPNGPGRPREAPTRGRA